MDQTTNFVASRVRKLLLARALISIVIAVIIVGVAMAAGAPFRSLLKPVKNLGTSTQISTSQIKTNMIVRIKADEIYDTGIYYYGDSSGKVGIVNLKNGALLINIPSAQESVIGKTNVELTGAIATITSTRSGNVDKFINGIAQDEKMTAGQQAALRASIPDVQLNYNNGWVFSLALTWIATIACALLILDAISRLILLGSPERSSAYRRLVKKGSPVSVAELAAKLDEAAAGGTVTRVGKSLYFCPEVVASFAGASGQLHPADDLIWIYVKVMRRRIYGVVPAGSNWSVMLCFTDKRAVTMAARNEAQAKDRIQEILSIHPNVLSGHSSDRQAKFNMGNMDALRRDLQNQGHPVASTAPAPIPAASGAVQEPQPQPHDPALLSGPGTAPVPAPTSALEQKQSWATGQFVSKTDKEVRRQMKAAKKEARAKRRRGEFDARDVSAPPVDMQASAPKEATAPHEASSFGLGDDEFGGDF
ncbi:MAG: hypothetical protein FWD65_01695 [Coriobacteriia bacterium]|nr:hypothetical protein [Coriobacteriia bacterium]